MMMEACHFSVLNSRRFAQQTSTIQLLDNNKVQIKMLWTETETQDRKARWFMKAWESAAWLSWWSDVGAIWLLLTHAGRKKCLSEQISRFHVSPIFCQQPNLPPTVLEWVNFRSRPREFIKSRLDMGDKQPGIRFEFSRLFSLWWCLLTTGSEYQIED